ncbi:MAG: MBOAT family O-acyltransferase, partial [Lachnospiraceae bacterium]
RKRVLVMGYVSFSYAALVASCFILYYLLPLRDRYIVLAVGSLLFAVLANSGIGDLSVFVGTLAIGYGLSRYLGKRRTGRGAGPLIWSLVLILLPLLLVKICDYLVCFGMVSKDFASRLPRPVGLSFYTLLLVAYLVDIWRGSCRAEENPAKYFLFVSFFPQLIQGPISREGETLEQLSTGHRFVHENLVRGLRLVLWGLFLKLVIADKAGVLVDAVFANPLNFSGVLNLIAALLYSIQLYADFSSCVCLSLGVARLFGITLPENFCHPYFAVGIRDFWRRWHMTLSKWLRDYVYIPLGGSRHGKAKKYRNLVLTFLVSGFWHGSSPAFLAWGLLHGVYQIAEDALGLGKKKRKDTETSTAFGPAFVRRIPGMVLTFLLVTLAWILFRAESFSITGKILSQILRGASGSGTFIDELTLAGTDGKEMIVLLAAIGILFIMSFLQEKSGNRPFAISDGVDGFPVPVRFLLELGLLAVIIVFGTYGAGYDANDFIYGGF